MSEKKPRGKSGALSNDEKRFIRDNVGRMAPQQIATHIGRSLEVVIKEITKWGPDPAKVESSERSVFRVELKQSPAWKRLSLELEKDELTFFEDRYVALMEQFKDDVLATEENQIFKAIKYDILMGRNMVQQKAAHREIVHLEKERERLADLGDFSALDESEKEYFLGLDKQVQDAMRRKRDLTTEYTKLDENHQRLLEDLKATRKQRVDKIESGKFDFLGLVRTMQEERARVEADRQIELMRRATAGETKRLSEPYRYADGALDRPLLTPELVQAERDAEDA